MKEDSKKKKRAYTKPQLRSINLAADEVLARSCKTTSTTGSPHLGLTCLASNCHFLGS
jgi:hypothetical protein